MIVGTACNNSTHGRYVNLLVEYTNMSVGFFRQFRSINYFFVIIIIEDK